MKQSARWQFVVGLAGLVVLLGGGHSRAAEPRGAVLHLACLAPLVADGATQTRPNLVLLLADDLGYGDLGCYGCPDISTPHLDQLARQGLRLTQCYANGPECTPTRAALLSGRYPQRVGGLECAIGLGNVGRYDDAIRLAGQRELGLPVAHSALARGLKAAGYQTAIFGKWHLGYEPQFAPRRHGFDQFFGPLGERSIISSTASRTASRCFTKTSSSSRAKAISPT